MKRIESNSQKDWVKNVIALKYPLVNKIVFYIMVLSTTLIGFFKGVLPKSSGKDAQWYPAKLLSENIDFYNFYLLNFEDWFMRSVPNYYFQLYYLLQPAGSMPWETFKLVWFFTNVAMLLLFLFLIKKDFGLGYREMNIVFLPFFIGFPLINLFTNGQSTLLILLLIYLVWKYRDNRVLLPILLSFLTIKYSFAIPILFSFLLMGYYRSVIWSGLITLMFPLIYSMQFGLDFISTVFLPFKVSTSVTANPIGSGPGDLMSLYGQLSDAPLIGVNILTITLAIFVAFFAFVCIKYQLDKKTVFLGSILFSLFGFFHFGHDYIIFLLLIPFAIKMRHFKLFYVYTLVFCFMPRIIRLLDMILQTNIGVKEFTRSELYVIFNVIVLISCFVHLIRTDVKFKKTSMAALTKTGKCNPQSG